MITIAMLDQAVPLDLPNQAVGPSVAVCESRAEDMAALVPVMYEDPMALLEAALEKLH